MLPCLGFQRLDDYTLIPRDSFPAQEMLQSDRRGDSSALLEVKEFKELRV